MNLQNNVGISGEFRVVVKRKDGSIRLDTGMQSNLITDNGLRFFLYDGSSVKNSNGDVVSNYTMGSDAFSYCLLGTGNKTPEVTDIALQNFVAISSSIKQSNSYNEDPDTGKHENYVKFTDEKVYVFNDIDNQNITELGLASYYSSYGSIYTLITRSLIKGSNGSPITITVLPGEILEVTYRLNLYFDIRQKKGEFTLTNGGDTQNFSYILQPYALYSRSSVSRPLLLQINYQNFVSRGVKEEDSALDSSYDLDTVFAGLNYKNDAPLIQKTANRKYTYSDSSPTSDYYAVVSTNIDIGSLTKTYTINNGIYTHIHEHGIRAFVFYVGNGSNSILCGIVIVKNKANGQGIKKTNKQTWQAVVSYTLSRYTG